MENNKLSIYREVLRFSCSILNLQEKIDQLITISKLCGYNVSCRFLSNNGVYFLRVEFGEDSILRFVIDFNYERESDWTESTKHIHIVNFYYDSENMGLENRDILGNEINDLIEELDKLIKVI